MVNLVDSDLSSPHFTISANINPQTDLTIPRAFSLAQVSTVVIRTSVWSERRLISYRISSSWAVARSARAVEEGIGEP